MYYGVPEYEIYLPKFACGNFIFTNADETKLRTILNKTLGREARGKTHFGFTTQKTESTNHALQRVH